jgi:hypothetical protein
MHGYDGRASEAQVFEVSRRASWCAVANTAYIEGHGHSDD